MAGWLQAPEAIYADLAQRRGFEAMRFYPTDSGIDASTTEIRGEHAPSEAADAGIQRRLKSATPVDREIRDWIVACSNGARPCLRAGGSG